MKSKKAIIRLIHERTQEFTSHKFQRSGCTFEAFRDLVGTIRSLGYLCTYDEKEMRDYPGNDSLESAKVQPIKITAGIGMVIEGSVSIFAAGTIENKWSSYDMTLQLW